MGSRFSSRKLSSSKQATMAEGGGEFDFTPLGAYGQEEFYKTVVKGPVELRQAVEAEVTKAGEPYLACLLGLSKDR